MEREKIVEAMARAIDGALFDEKGDELLRAAQAALTALEALGLVVSQGWQDIASAPRDGAKFDVWVPDAFGGRRMCGLSFNAKGQLRQHGLLTEADLPRWPTHWMHLPAAPQGRG